MGGAGGGGMGDALIGVSEGILMVSEILTSDSETRCLSSL